MTQIRVRTNNFQNKLTVPGKAVQLRARVVSPTKRTIPISHLKSSLDNANLKAIDLNTKPAGHKPFAAAASKPPPSFGQKQSSFMPRAQPSTAFKKPTQKPVQYESDDDDGSDDMSDVDLEELQKYADLEDEDEGGEEIDEGQEEEGEDDEGEDGGEEDEDQVEATKKPRIGPSALKATPESLSKTPKNAGWHMIVDPDKYHNKPLPSGRQAKIELPEEDEDEEEFEEDEEGEEGEEGEEEDEEIPGYMHARNPKTAGMRKTPRSVGADPEFKDKVKDLAELYTLHQMGFEPQTGEYDLNTDNQLISQSIKRGTQDLMKSETVTLGQAMICMVGSLVERGSIYANSYLEQRGSLNRVPDCSHFSWFLDSPEIKVRFEEPLKRVHHLYGAKIREINPLWSLGMIFLGTLFQYADARRNTVNQQQQQMMTPQMQQQQQQMMYQQQQMMNQQQQQMRTPSPQMQQQVMYQQQQMMNQQQMRAPSPQMQQQVAAQVPNPADEERRQKLLKMKEMMQKRSQAAAEAEQKKTTLVEQDSIKPSAPENRVTENLRIETQYDPDIESVVQMMKTMNPLERRQFSQTIQTGQIPQRPSQSHYRAPRQPSRPIKPPVLTRGVRQSVEFKDESDSSSYDDQSVDSYSEDYDSESEQEVPIPKWQPTTPGRLPMKPKTPRSNIRKPASIDIGVTPVRTPPA